MNNEEVPIWRLAATLIGLLLLISGAIVAVYSLFIVTTSTYFTVGIVAGLAGMILMVAGGEVKKK